MNKTPAIITGLARVLKHSGDVARTTDIRGRSFRAYAVEFSERYEPVERITLNIHPDSPLPDDVEVESGVVSGQVYIGLDEVTLFVPEGREHALLAALSAAIAEQARHA